MALASAPVFGAHWNLFNPDFLDPDYQEQLAMVRAGDTVLVKDKTFKLGAYLDEGSISKIFDLGNGTIIRIPKSINPAFLKWSRQYFDSYFILKNSGIPMPHVHANISHPPYYIIVDKVDVKFNLEQFFTGGVEVDEVTRARVRAAIIKLAEQTAEYSHIPDFKAANVIWNGEILMLLDRMSDGIKKAVSVDDTPAFHYMKYLPDDIRAEMTAAVKRKRLAMPCFKVLAEAV